MSLHMILQLLEHSSRESRELKLVELGVDKVLWSHIHSCFDENGELYTISDREDWWRHTQWATDADGKFSE